MTKHSAQEIDTYLEAITQRGFKQYCDNCGQRNSIENLFYCIVCKENCCWQCTNTRLKKIDSEDGLTHPECKCGSPLKAYDTWLNQAHKHR